MEKLSAEAYSILRTQIAVLLCGRSTDSIERCVDGWMMMNDIGILLEHLYKAGHEPKNE